MVFGDIPNAIVVGAFTLLGVITSGVITYMIVKREQEGENQRLIAGVRDERKVNSLLDINKKLDEFFRLIKIRRTDDHNVFSFEQEILNEFTSLRNSVQLYSVWYTNDLAEDLDAVLEEFGTATRYFEWIPRKDQYHGDEPPAFRNPNWGDIEEAYDDAKESLKAELSEPIESIRE